MEFAQPAALIGALAGVVWWLLKRFDSRIDEVRERADKLIAEERASRDANAQADRNLFMAALDASRKEAKEDRHEFRDELQDQTNALHEYKLEAAEKFISRGHLTEAIAPLRDVIEGLRTDLRQVFEKLDGKADKRVGH